MKTLAAFFQRHDGAVMSVLKKLYTKVFLFNDKRIIQFLRDSGASIGKNVHISSTQIFGSEPYLITVGDNTYFSGGEIKMYTHDGSIMQLYYMGYTEKKMDLLGRINIGKNCFIGANSTILYSVTIGDNCIIGANSVVTKDIPDNSVACGVPAKVICSVEEFYRKHKDELTDTYGMRRDQKRQLVKELFDGKP